MSATTSPSVRTDSPARAVARGAAVLGALLCLAIAYIHCADQGGYSPSEWFPGDKDPEYIKYGYYVLEAVAVVTALLLLTRARLAWLLAAGVALGPFVAFVLTRTTGLPDAKDDIGNWGEPLGIAALVTEGVLFLLALSQLARRRA